MARSLLGGADVEVGVRVHDGGRAPDAQLVHTAARRAGQRAGGGGLRAQHAEVQPALHSNDCHSQTTLERSTAHE